jgi:phosphate:Na+ symporter
MQLGNWAMIYGLNMTKNFNHINQMSYGKLAKQSFEEMNANLEQCLWSVDPEKAHTIEKQINTKRNGLRKRHFEDLKAKKYKHKVGVFYTDVFSLSEKIGDYVINVTEAIEESKKY